MVFAGVFTRKKRPNINSKPPQSKLNRNYKKALNNLNTTRRVLTTYTDYVDFWKGSCDLKSPKKLRDETFMEAFNRSLVFLYQKIHRIPINKSVQKLTKEQNDEVRKVIKTGYAKTKDMKKLANLLFGTTDVDTFNKELQEFENYSTDKIIDKGKRTARCSFSVASYLGRIVSLVLYTEKEIQYAADFSDNVSAMGAPGSVAISTSLKTFKDYQDEIGIPLDTYIIVKPKYFIPSPPKQGVIFVRGDRLQAISFIRDAVAAKGIIKSTVPL